VLALAVFEMATIWKADFGKGAVIIAATSSVQAGETARTRAKVN